MAMQDIYDFFYDVNQGLIDRGLQRLDDMLRPAIMSGVLSDMLTASLAKHSRSLTVNLYHNGHPDLVVSGTYPDNKVKSGSEGVEIKTTRKAGGAVDTHGARDQWMCVFVYDVDTSTEPARDRKPMAVTEVYLGQVEVAPLVWTECSLPYVMPGGDLPMRRYAGSAGCQSTLPPVCDRQAFGAAWSGYRTSGSAPTPVARR